MPTRRVRFRPPGVKPWTRVGPLGPFRGRLGLAWVIAPLIVGAVLLVAGWAFLLRSSTPGGSFRAVGPASSFPEGSARAVSVPGVFVGRTTGRLFAVRADSGCSLTLCSGRYADCRGAVYGLDGKSEATAGALDLLPLTVHGGLVYVDPEHPVERHAAPAPAHPGICPSP